MSVNVRSAKDLFVILCVLALGLIVGILTTRHAQNPISEARAASVPGGIPAAMAGRILKVAVEPGQAVKAGDLVLVFEAMKMENELRSAQDGIVKEVRVKAGDRVNLGDILLVID